MVYGRHNLPTHGCNRWCWGCEADGGPGWLFPAAGVDPPLPAAGPELQKVATGATGGRGKFSEYGEIWGNFIIPVGEIHPFFPFGEILIYLLGKFIIFPFGMLFSPYYFAHLGN